MRKVAVIFGGKSCENEISILSGVFVLNLLRGEKFLPLPVYVHIDGTAYTSKKMHLLETFKRIKVKEFDRVFFEGGNLYAFEKGEKKVRKIFALFIY